MNATFLIMAGGTGGHVFPALATAKKLQDQGLQVAWLGSKGGFEERVVNENNIPFFGLSISGLRGKGLGTLLLAPFKLLAALAQAMRVLFKLKPVCVLGMGGFAAGPGGVAARLQGRPLIVHEQNAVAGLTNRILARFATKVYEAFPDSFGDSMSAVLIGNPIREDIVALHQLLVRSPRAALEGRAPRLLVLGGSLGALKLNETLPAALANLKHDLRPEVRHQAGRGKLEAAQAAYTKLGVDALVTEFIDDMAEAYAWADFVVCRAGALTVSELCATGLGAILVPFPHAVDDHQTLNAQSMVKQGGAWLAPQDELSAESLSEMLEPLLSKPQRIQRLGLAAFEMAKPYAAEALADGCRSAANV